MPRSTSSTLSNTNSDRPPQASASVQGRCVGTTMRAASSSTCPNWRTIGLTKVSRMRIEARLTLPPSETATKTSPISVAAEAPVSMK